jgi:CRISPR-associated endonuclease/helicase Cas3
MLTADDFRSFFEEAHGCAPFPWQKRLLEYLVAKGTWPSVLDLPTGSGKTAAIDIAVFHLALEADRFNERCAPARIAFVVDRRLVVDDAFERARKLEAALAKPPHGSVTACVAERLKMLSGDGPPLIARRLRGGIPREGDWARTPSQPTVLCSTVDQVGSRLLFRGYGVSDSMKPVHGGLIGSDCLILLDEAHLAEPFRQTMDWIGVYRGANWRESNVAGPWGFALLTATPGEKPKDAFSLDDEDQSNPVLRARLEATKLARLIAPAKSKKKTAGAAEIDDEDEESGGGAKDLVHRVSAIIDEVIAALRHFKDDKHGAPRPAIGVVVNRVTRAREVFKRVVAARNTTAGESLPEPVLMIGPARPVDREGLVSELDPIRTRVWKDGENRALEKPLILVATQCIESGVDIDLDALITEAAPLDSLQQRFGRLNRAGRPITPYAAIIAGKSDLTAKVDDPVYGKAIKPAWDYLSEWARRGNRAVVDLGIRAMRVQLDKVSPPEAALTEKPDAPVLLPAHLDLLSQTSPVPAADPDVGLYLHGLDRQPDSIAVIWRADIDPAWTDQDLIRLLTLVPPRSLEAIELPLGAVRRWLRGVRGFSADIADIPAKEFADEEGLGGRRVFRWKGNDERSQWVDPAALRQGDTIIVPASYGGVDAFGWDPGCTDPARDVAQKAAKPFVRKRFAVRIAPGLLEQHVSNEALSATLADVRAENWQTVRQALLDLGLPAEINQALASLDDAKGRRGKPSVAIDFDLHGENEKGEPRGLVILAPFGVKATEPEKVTDGDEGSRPNSTEDDTAGSIFDFPLSLEEHSRDVESKAEELSKRAGLPAERVADLKLAGFLHDQGKRDPRFQAWLHFGDPLGFDPNEETDILAKSGRTLPPAARGKAGLPDRWRHEALSVRLARTHPCLARANDPDLVVWLVGSHHGYGRPLFPHYDPSEKAPDIGPQSLAFDWNGLDWPSLFARLKARYGVWELARMEAILRLADHRASEEARERAAKEDSE